jgi:hypothetical protein
MLKATYYSILIALTLIISSCNSEVNSETILGEWSVQSVEIISDNVEEEHVQTAEDRVMTISYTFLEGETLKTFDGTRNLKKGGDFMLDEKRKVLTINEEYNGIKVSSVLWAIEASTSESMTLFQDTPGKSSTRMTIVKTR